MKVKRIPPYAALWIGITPYAVSISFTKAHPEPMVQGALRMMVKNLFTESVLLDGDRLGQVTWLVDITSPEYGYVVRKQL